MKITHTAAKFATIATLGITSVVGAGALAGVASAGAVDGEESSASRAARIASLCEHSDEIVPRLTERQDRVREWIDTLEAAQQRATEAGRRRAAERIERRIAALETRLDQIAGRITDAPAWIAEHCS